LIATDYSGSQTRARDTRSFGVRARDAFTGLDVLGLLIFAAAWSLLLIPLTVVNSGRSSWHSGRQIAMLVVGCVLLVVFGVYEYFWARVPIIPPRFLKSRLVFGPCMQQPYADEVLRTVVATWAISFFDFVSFYLQVSVSLPCARQRTDFVLLSL
jgi:uncharacterized membrane protein YbhN (UPF0104 family)